MRAIHLHHIGQIELEGVAQRLLHRGVIAPDIVDGVAAEEIEVRLPRAIVEIGALRPGVHLIEADDPLHGDEGGIQVALVQRVVFAEAGLHGLFDVEGHGSEPATVDGIGGFASRKVRGRGGAGRGSGPIPACAGGSDRPTVCTPL